MSVEFSVPLAAYMIAGTNYIDTLSRVNSTKGLLTMRPSIVAGKLTNPIKPVAVDVGAHAGYTMPIYASDNQELFFRDYIPGRWDGASDPIVSIICAIDTTQSGGVTKDFKFQLSFDNQAIGGAISASTHDLSTNVVCLANEAQYTLHKVEFTVPRATYSPNLLSSDHIGFRLRRITADGTAITGNPIVLDCLITYQVDKVFKSTPTTTTTTTSI